MTEHREAGHGPPPPHFQVPNRQRDIFPLPAPDWSRGDLRHLVRGLPLHQKVVLRQQGDGVIRSLNELFAEVSPSRRESPNVVQRASQLEILKQLPRGHAPGPVYKHREAAEALLKTSLSYGEEQASSTVRSYQEGLLSIPQGGYNAPSLASILDSKGREILVDFHQTLLH